MSNIEMYIVSNCPKCRKANWLYNGDPDDCTHFEPEGLKCWNCKACWIINEDNIIDEDDDPYYEDGKHFEEVK